MYRLEPTEPGSIAAKPVFVPSEINVLRRWRRGSDHYRGECGDRPE